MSPGKTSSIKDYAIRYAVMIFVVVFLAASVHYFIYGFFLKKLHDSEYVQQLEYSADSVTRLLGFYQDIVDKMAQQHSVIDMLQFGSNSEVQAWSVDMQRMLPGSIGLALFDEAGNVRGRRSELKLSDHCFIDMQRRFSGLPVPRPPVHYKIQDFAHFDIVSPVILDGQKIGLLFASFSLEIIDELLKGMSRDDYALQIITPEKYMLASAGWTEGEATDYYEMIIPETDWLMKSQVIDTNKNIFVASLLISNILAFILVSVVLALAINKLFRLVVTDFEKISWMMHSIRDGDFDPEKVPRPTLHETAGVVRFIRHAGEELSVYQKKLKQESNTDELTGLYNRRMLNERLDSCLQKTGHNEQVYVVILDLDHFKQINDKHGHELGDTVLKRMAQSLRDNLNYEDLAARAGGDEFIVVLDGYKKDEVDRWYKKLLKEFLASMADLASEHGIEFDIGVSAGCTWMRAGDDKRTLLKRADKALYDVKARGRNHIICT